MNEKKNPKQRQVGRIPKKDPAVFRYSISFNSVDHARFLSLFEASEAKNKAYFITSCIFDKPLKLVKTDKGIHDYYMQLTTFFGRFRAIGNTLMLSIPFGHQLYWVDPVRENLTPLLTTTSSNRLAKAFLFTVMITSFPICQK